MNWDDAYCTNADPDIFFPDKAGDNTLVKNAKALCERCPVSNECLQYALERNCRWGIWGGTTHLQRVKLGYARETDVDADCGTNSGYRRGCRCEPCCAAASVHRRRQRSAA